MPAVGADTRWPARWPSGSFLVTLPIRGQRRLLAMGRIAPASVAAHGKRVRTSHGSDLGVRYEYQFPLLSGAIARGQGRPRQEPSGGRHRHRRSL